MEPRHPRLPSSNHLPDTPGPPSRWHPEDRSTQDRYAGPSPMMMQIPTSSRGLTAPPPLPPPRYVSDSLPESDEGISGDYGSCGGRDEHRGSAIGASFPRNWGHPMQGKKHSERSDFSRRESATGPSSWTRSPTDSERRYEAMKQHEKDEGYYSLSGPSPGLPGLQQ